jgi:hypothetical protein
MGELLTERTVRNGKELKLFGLSPVGNADKLSRPT